MKRWLLFCIVFLCLAGGVWYGYGRYQAFQKIPDSLLAREAADALEKTSTLMLKGLNLVQGEKGIEFWRLKATWAGMEQTDSSIEVTQPDVWYTLGDGAGNDRVHAVSKHGKITDNQRVLTMWGDVVLTRFDQTILAPVMVYYANERAIHFPQGAEVRSAKGSGTFKRLKWSMPDNTIMGEGGISVLFQGAPTRVNR